MSDRDELRTENAALRARMAELEAKPRSRPCPDCADSQDEEPECETCYGTGLVAAAPQEPERPLCPKCGQYAWYGPQCFLCGTAKPERPAEDTSYE
jgi:hypothetical protein